MAFLAVVSSPAAGTAGSQKRLALVIGNVSYPSHALATPVNDAALISQTLQAAGFEVTGARDLDGVLLRRTFRDFADKVTNAGPDAIALVYFAGEGLQFEGKNYLVPVGTDIAVASDIPARAFGLSEAMHGLAAAGVKTSFVILDAARASPFGLQGQAGGLAWIEPEANMLIAYNAAPGTVAPDVGGNYGPYARALAEMIREGDLTPANLFDRVRLRVHELTKGAQIPWDASKIETPFKFFERTPAAPARTDAPERTAQFRLQPMRALGPQNAYITALMRDTFDAYTDFLADYWQDPMTKRVRALLAARRESITWQRTCQANEPNAYWSYLERYPHGPHVADAGRLLTQMGAATTLPSQFARIDYDVPPPLPDELEYIERPTLILDDPELGFEHPPPTPANFLESPPQDLLNLRPAAASGAHTLPVLNLPLQAFLRIPPDGKASPNPSQSAREAWVMKPAIDVPTVPEKQAESLPISSLASNTANDLVNEMRSSASIDGATQNKNSNPPIGDQDAANEMSSRLSSPSQLASGAPPQWFNDIVNTRNRGSLLEPPLAYSEVSTPATSMFAPAAAGLTFVPPLQETKGLSEPIVRSAALQPSQNGLSEEVSAGAILSPQMPPLQSPPTSETRTALPLPAWLTDVLTNRSPRISPELPIVDSELLISAPSMFASASAGLTFQTWRYGIPSSLTTLRASAPFAPALARPRGALVGQNSSAAILSPQPMGSMWSTPRSATLTPAAIGRPSNPNVNGAEPSSTADQVKPRKKPSRTKPVPSNQVAHDPNEVAPPNPE